MGVLGCQVGHRPQFFPLLLSREGGNEVPDIIPSRVYIGGYGVPPPFSKSFEALARGLRDTRAAFDATTVEAQMKCNTSPKPPNLPANPKP